MSHFFLKSLWEGDTGDDIPIPQVRLTRHEWHLGPRQQPAPLPPALSGQRQLRQDGAFVRAASGPPAPPIFSLSLMPFQVCQRKLSPAPACSAGSRPGTFPNLRPLRPTLRPRSTLDTNSHLHGRTPPAFRKKDIAGMQLNTPFLAPNLEYDDNTHSFSKVDNPRKDPFLSSCILLLFRILWRENVRQENRQKRWMNEGTLGFSQRFVTRT